MRTLTATFATLAAAGLAAIPAVAAPAAGTAAPAAGGPCIKRDVGKLAQARSGWLACKLVKGKLVWVKAAAPRGPGGPGNGQGNGQGNTSGQGSPGPAPVLTRLPVALAPWSAGATSAGSVLFTAETKLEDEGARDGGVIYASGRPFADHPPEPSLTFRYLDPEAQVVSPLDGVVVAVRDQPGTCDSEIGIVPKGAGTSGGTWEVSLDHVRNPQVRQGQTVTAGTVLGKPGPSKNGCAGPYRVELQVNRPGSPMAVCPLSVFSAAAASTARDALVRLMRDWNQFTGREVHGAADIAGAGCLAAETRA